MSHKSLTRRSLIRNAALMSVGAALGPTALARKAQAATVPSVLVHTMLYGGSDMRFLFAPMPGSPTAEAYFTARNPIYTMRFDGGLQPYGTYEELFDGEYLTATYGGESFGIHKSAAWLHDRFTAGKAAIVANAVLATNRRHDHAQLMMLAGSTDVPRNDFNRSGWGGRLAEALNPGMVVSCAPRVPVFCQGTSGLNRFEPLVHLENSRKFGLPYGTGREGGPNRILSRALTAYYAARGPEVLATTDDRPDRILFEHEHALRSRGDGFNARLQSVMPTAPEVIENLRMSTSPVADGAFSRGIANLYDALLAADILNMRVVYLDRIDWDTHSQERDKVVEGFTDLFSMDGGIATLERELAVSNPDAVGKLTYTFGSDFGRQIASNGDNGTDHGDGTYSVLVGDQVRGGVYGEMFPLAEIATDATGTSPYTRNGSGIVGRTDLARVFGTACNWLQQGAADTVFPGWNSTALETGVTLDLFS